MCAIVSCLRSGSKAPFGVLQTELCKQQCLRFFRSNVASTGSNLVKLPGDIPRTVDTDSRRRYKHSYADDLVYALRLDCPSPSTCTYADTDRSTHT